MISRPDIVCFSSIDWDFIWQGHQEIMSRLAADGHRVLFVENTGVRAARVSDIGRLRHRLQNWWRGTKGFREERPNVWVYSPLIVPLPYSRIAGWINRQLMARSLRRWMRAAGFGRPIAWTFLPTPLVRAVIADLDPSAVIYHCVDDFASSSPQARRIAESENRLLADADLVFVTSERLRARAAQHARSVHLFPSGVSVEAFAAARRDPQPVPDDVASLPRPIAGYVGGLHQWVDQDLLAKVAAQLPEMSFVLVGPQQTDVSALEKLPNIRMVGSRPHPMVPRYIDAFDVGLVPYRIAEYTENVYPAKMNEYLAMGKPVVATNLAEVRKFRANHGDVIRVGNDAAAFAEAVRALAGTSSAEDAARRIAVAESNGWDRRVAAMRQLIDGVLEEKTASARGWEERLKRLYTRARRRTAEMVGAAIVAYLLLFYTPLVWWLAEPLRVTAAPAAADAIVVFAGGVGESGKAGVGFQERLTQAVALYRAGYAPRMVFSSGYVFTLREAALMKAVAVDNGVPAEAILLEERAANTYQNVAFTGAILNDHGWRRVLLVSSPYHMRRALLTWRSVAPGIEVIAAPPPATQFYTHERGATLEQIRGIGHEYMALLYYWYKGWV